LYRTRRERESFPRIPPISYGKREASLGFYRFPRERDKLGIFSKSRPGGGSRSLSLNSLSLSVAALTSILIYCYSQFTHGYQQMWIGGQYHGHVNLSPQNGNVTAASYYYAPASYCYSSRSLLLNSLSLSLSVAALTLLSDDVAAAEARQLREYERQRRSLLPGVRRRSDDDDRRLVIACGG
jgi:hypothetical protein